MSDDYTENLNSKITRLLMTEKSERYKEIMLNQIQQIKQLVEKIK